MNAASDCGNGTGEVETNESKVADAEGKRWLVVIFTLYARLLHSCELGCYSVRQSECWNKVLKKKRSCVYML